MKTAEVTVDETALLKYANNTGLQFQVYKDSIHRLVRVMAKAPPIPDAGLYRINQTIKREPAEWTYSKWARAVKWMLRKRWLRWIIPFPIERLVHAEYVTYAYETVKCEESLWSLIHGQIAEIKMDGREPKCIIIGFQAFHDLARDLNFNFSTPSLPTCSTEWGEIAGVPAILSHRVSPNSCLVV